MCQLSDTEMECTYLYRDLYLVLIITTQENNYYIFSPMLLSWIAYLLSKSCFICDFRNFFQSGSWLVDILLFIIANYLISMTKGLSFSNITYHQSWSQTSSLRILWFPALKLVIKFLAWKEAIYDLSLSTSKAKIDSPDLWKPRKSHVWGRHFYTM